jgi:hypothetical protein
MQIGASVMTQDGDEMVVSATLRWRAQDGVGAQSEAVLRAAFEAAAVAVAARHRAAELNGAFGEIASFTRQTLAALARDADGFGVELTAAAGAASLPAAVRAPADAAEAEALRAEAALAAVRDAAALQLQTTDHDRDRMFAEARKAAAARVAAAREHAAAVTGLEARMSAASRPALLAEFYRERIAAILRQAGSVSTVDPKSVSKVVIPDSGP